MSKPKSQPVNLTKKEIVTLMAGLRMLNRHRGGDGFDETVFLAFNRQPLTEEECVELGIRLTEELDKPKKKEAAAK